MMNDEDLWRLRAIVQRTGWLEFMRTVGSLMAEQADKMDYDSVQSSALFNVSCVIHHPTFEEKTKDCGFFDYRPWFDWLDVPESYQGFFKDGPPDVSSQ